jgi:hypothetical protein
VATGLVSLASTWFRAPAVDRRASGAEQAASGESCGYTERKVGGDGVNAAFVDRVMPHLGLQPSLATSLNFRSAVFPPLCAYVVRTEGVRFTQA